LPTRRSNEKALIRTFATVNIVMAGLGPAIHAFDFCTAFKTWMPATGAA